MARCPIDHPTCHRETEKECPSKDEKGNPICTMGLTSIPVLNKQGGYTVYELIPLQNGSVSVKLSMTHRAYIKLLAERGGEQSFDYGKVEESKRDALRHHLDDLTKMGIMKETPIIGSGDSVIHRLTDTGRSIATTIIKSVG